MDMLQKQPGASSSGREPQVKEQTNKLEKSLEQLHSEIQALTERISSILRLPNVKEEELQNAKREVELVPLATIIAASRESVQKASRRITSILEKLEL